MAVYMRLLLGDLRVASQFCSNLYDGIEQGPGMPHLGCVQVAGTFGNMGVVALLPILGFFGSGVLTPKDFNALPWAVIVMMGGGPGERRVTCQIWWYHSG